jgi:hypothetical protein
VLVVGDNGIGLPADVEPQNPSSLGLRLVYTLAQQLRGRVDLSRENGTSFTIVRDASEPPAFNYLHKYLFLIDIIFWQQYYSYIIFTIKIALHGLLQRLDIYRFNIV